MGRRERGRLVRVRPRNRVVRPVERKAPDPVAMSHAVRPAERKALDPVAMSHAVRPVERKAPDPAATDRVDPPAAEAAIAERERERERIKKGKRTSKAHQRHQRHYEKKSGNNSRTPPNYSEELSDSRTWPRDSSRG